MNFDEAPITGYVDRFSRRPGEVMAAHVSVRDGGQYKARLVRVLSADANPDGPGMRFEDLSDHFAGVFAGCRRPISRGSYADAPGPSLEAFPAVTWTALVHVGHLAKRRQVILSHEDGRAAISLYIAGEELTGEISDTGTSRACETVFDRRLNTWYRVWLSCDTQAGEMRVGCRPVGQWGAKSHTAYTSIAGCRLPSGGRFLIAAANRIAPTDHFDGKIEDPAILSGSCSSWPEPELALPSLSDRLIAGWDFSENIKGQSIIGTGPQRSDGVLRNLPSRAVTGVRWNGECMHWGECPAHYGAIHFHSDIVGDCGWPVSFEFPIPKDLCSGAYAFRLECEGGEDWLPFYVLPPAEGPHARMVFVAPTFTYQAYANAIAGYIEDFKERVRAWNAYPYDARDYPVYGRSLYDLHPDGSGVSLSSRLRPILSMRPGAITVLDAKGSGVRHYSSDLHLLAWLESQGFACDIVTDEDLHEEGVSILEPYALVLTGTHPEYQTAQSLNAFRDYLQRGGNLAYLGGNGFYWRVAKSPECPDVIELRRAEGGTRIWASKTGEYYHALDGTYGGLWRHNGRTPQSLVGVGFSAQGPFEATHYTRTEASRSETVSWIFDGVTDEVIGDYGLSAGGAAGYEVDRADVCLGTPPEAVIIATSARMPASFYPTMEEMLIKGLTFTGASPESLLRSDMVYYRTPAGGAVFSVGSITFCGSLWKDGFCGPVSRILENIVRRFSTSTGNDG